MDNFRHLRLLIAFSIALLLVIGVIFLPQLSQARPMLDTPVNTHITSNTTWDLAGSPYVINSNIDIRDGAVLTITAGVQVRFAQNTSLDVASGSALYVFGSQGSPVSFTSNLTPTAAGDWLNIDVEAGATAVLDHCEIAHGGRFSSHALGIYSTENVAVSDCDIHSSLGRGVFINGVVGISPVFTNVTIRDNGGAAAEQGGNASPAYGNVTMSGNSDDGINLTGDYNVPVTLDGSGLNGGKFVATTGIDINAGGVLTFAAGTTLTFASGQSNRVAGWL